MATPTQIRLLITTWNVGNQAPSDFPALITPIVAGELDMIVLGLQEASYSGKEGVRDHTHFLENVTSCLGQGWEAIATKQLGEMMLLVFMRSDWKSHISDIHMAVERTGVADVGSNKGGIAIRFSLKKVSFTFVSSHLAAHEGASSPLQR